MGAFTWDPNGYASGSIPGPAIVNGNLTVDGTLTTGNITIPWTRNSGNNPFIYFDGTGGTVSDWIFGVDDSDSDSFKISQSATLGTNDYLTVTTAGAVTLGSSGSTETHTVNGALSVSVNAANLIEATRSGSGSAAGIKTANDDAHWWVGMDSDEAWGVRYNGDSAGTQFIRVTSAGAATIGASGGVALHRINGSLSTVQDGALHVLSGTAGAGDIYTRWAYSGAASYSWGIDDSDSDAFKLTYSASGGANPSTSGPFGVVTTAGAWTLGSSGSTETHTVNGALASPININTFSGTSVAFLNSYRFRKLVNAGTKTMQGMVAGADGQIITYINSGGNLTVANESGSATAENRIITGTGADITITGDGAVTFVYDKESDRWRVVSVQN